MPKKKKHRHQTEPTTPDEFLAAGVELEEAAEKWRAGDSVKSFRFYERALHNYEEALRLFPRTFDVAYNKYVILYAYSCIRAFRGSVTSILSLNGL